MDNADTPNKANDIRRRPTKEQEENLQRDADALLGVTQCELCRHSNHNGTCKAFPKQIPMDILTGEHDHATRHPDQDNDVLFESSDSGGGMRGGTGPELHSHGGGGISYWGQVQCKECNAWLREMPDRSEEIQSDCEDFEKAYVYAWACLACGAVREEESFTPPEEWTPNPDAELHEPGTHPPPVVRDAEKWDAADSLSPAQKSLVRCCWEMLDTLEGAFTIHKVTYTWDLVAALKAQDIKAVIRSARAYVKLLDHEAVHGQDSGSYGGAEGDVTEIRSVLAKI